MKQVIKIALGIVLGFVILVVGCTGLFVSSVDNSDTNTNTTKETVSKGEDYEFVSEPEVVSGEFGTQSIVGVIKNNSGVDKGYIQVSFTLYDADGNNIGTALANTNNLKADGTWKFEAVILEDNVASFELDEVTGF